MKNVKVIFLALVLPAFFLASCSKDDKKTTNTVTYKEPTIASRGDVVTIPSGLQAQADTSLNASLAVTYMGLANGIASFAGDFTVPENAQQQNLKNGSKVYYWTYGGYSYWMTYTENTTNYNWKYEYEFPDVPRFTFIEANEMKDGKSGDWAIYDPEAGTHAKFWDYVWTINSSNDFTADLNMYDNSGSGQNNTFHVLARANNSGTFTFYVANVKTVEVNWNADGSGTWWISYGSETYSGSWAAGK